MDSQRVGDDWTGESLFQFRNKPTTPAHRRFFKRFPIPRNWGIGIAGKTTSGYFPISGESQEVRGNRTNLNHPNEIETSSEDNQTCPPERSPVGNRDESSFPPVSRHRGVSMRTDGRRGEGDSSPDYSPGAIYQTPTPSFSGGGSDGHSFDGEGFHQTWGKPKAVRKATDTHLPPTAATTTLTVPLAAIPACQTGGGTLPHTTERLEGTSVRRATPGKP